MFFHIFLQTSGRLWTGPGLSERCQRYLLSPSKKGIEEANGTCFLAGEPSQKHEETSKLMENDHDLWWFLNVVNMFGFKAWLINSFGAAMNSRCDGFWCPWLLHVHRHGCCFQRLPGGRVVFFIFSHDNLSEELPGLVKSVTPKFNSGSSKIQRGGRWCSWSSPVASQVHNEKILSYEIISSQQLVILSNL